MHEEIDPLEEELSQLRPVVPSPSLHASIGRRLGSREGFARRLRIFAGATALAAGSAAAFVFLHRQPVTEPQAADPVVSVAGVDKSCRCSLAVLSRAAKQSPEALDSLLTEESARRERRPPSDPVRAFNWNFSTL